MKIKLAITLLLTLIISTANALDVRKLNSSDFIGGNPYKSGSASEISRTGYPIGKPSMYDRTRRMPSKYGDTKGKKIIDLYQGSSHQQLLRQQINNYRASAKENERVFGAPYRKQPTKKLDIEDLIKQGAIKIILGKDGKKYLVENK